MSRSQLAECIHNSKWELCHDYVSTKAGSHVTNKIKRKHCVETSCYTGNFVSNCNLQCNADDNETLQVAGIYVRHLQLHVFSQLAMPNLAHGIVGSSSQFLPSLKPCAYKTSTGSWTLFIALTINVFSEWKVFIKDSDVKVNVQFKQYLPQVELKNSGEVRKPSALHSGKHTECATEPQSASEANHERRAQLVLACSKSNWGTSIGVKLPAAFMNSCFNRFIIK